jgi:hypothetical protein
MVLPSPTPSPMISDTKL